MLARPLLLVLAASACATNMGFPPVARIVATPRAIPEHDGFATDVVLDGTTSDDPVDGEDGGAGLAFHWQIDNDAVEWRAGDARAATATVRFAGERPAIVRLTVTDADGLASTVTLDLQLTLAAP